MTPEQELWAVALWVEKHHGLNGPDHIAEQVTRLAAAAILRAWPCGERLRIVSKG